MGAFTCLKIIITEEATENVLQSLLKPYGEGDVAARSRCSPAMLGPLWKSCGARGALTHLPSEWGRGTEQQVRPCAPRTSRGGLSVSGFDRAVCSGGGWGFGFSTAANTLPKILPIGACLLYYSIKQNEAIRSPDARALLRRVPPGSCGRGPGPCVCRYRREGRADRPGPFP